MDSNDIGRNIIVIISSDKTIKGRVTGVLTDLVFEVTDDWGNSSVWNITEIKGFRWKGDA